MPVTLHKKSSKPVTPDIQKQPPAIGSRVKVWFDKSSKEFIVQDDGGAISNDIYGVCLGDVLFDTETAPRGALRCVAVGSFLAVPGTRESQEIERQIRAQVYEHSEFYWWRDKRRPIARAWLAYIAPPPRGGFPTSLVVGPMAAEERVLIKREMSALRAKATCVGHPGISPFDPVRT